MSIRERDANTYQPEPSSPQRDRRALLAAGDALAEALREAIGVVHQTDSLRSHADPNDKTGWNLGPIETCEDGVCVDGLAALARWKEAVG